MVCRSDQPHHRRGRPLRHAQCVRACQNGGRVRVAQSFGRRFDLVDERSLSSGMIDSARGIDRPPRYGHRGTYLQYASALLDMRTVRLSKAAQLIEGWHRVERGRPNPTRTSTSRDAAGHASHLHGRIGEHAFINESYSQ